MIASLSAYEFQITVSVTLKEDGAGEPDRRVPTCDLSVAEDVETLEFVSIWSRGPNDNGWESASSASIDSAEVHVDMSLTSPIQKNSSTASSAWLLAASLEYELYAL